MMTFFIANMATIIISAVIIGIVTAIIISIVKNRKKGKTSCGCGCSDCAMSESCHSKK